MKNQIKKPQVSFKKFARQAFREICLKDWENVEDKSKGFQDYYESKLHLFPNYKNVKRQELMYSWKKFKKQIDEFYKNQNNIEVQNNEE